MKIRTKMNKGNCLQTAFNMVRKHPKLFFCIGKIHLKNKGEIEHAWNEVRGIKRIENEKEIVEENDNGELFVLDFSGDKSIVEEKEKYYKNLKINEKEVIRLSSEEVGRRINECDIFEYLIDKSKSGK